MPKKIVNALTPLHVKNAKPGRYADGAGLYLLVKPTGARSWVYRATIAGKVRDVGLGPAGGHDAIPLAQARELARDKTREVASGQIPMSDRRRRIVEAKAAEEECKVASARFRDVAEAFIARNEDSWRNGKHRKQWSSSLEAYAYPVIGDLLVSEITTDHVLKIIEPIWKEKSETANRVRGRIERILNAAKAQGLRSGENPALWRGHLDQVLPKRSRLVRGHHSALPFQDMPTFMAKLAARDAVAARALEYTILTAARSGEVLGATWGEVGELAHATAMWIVPAVRMKAGKEHRVPLSSRAVDILVQMQGLRKTESPEEPIFPGARGGPLSGMAMAMLLRRMDQPDITVHGFRSTFRDWASETTTFSHEVCEMALAHVIANKAEAAYRRGDLITKRRELMDSWADYCGRRQSGEACRSNRGRSPSAGLTATR